MDSFPEARIWQQKDELQYYAGEAWQSRSTHGGMDPDDVIEAVKLNTMAMRKRFFRALLAIPAEGIRMRRSLWA
jgi:hypothetical protein